MRYLLPTAGLNLLLDLRDDFRRAREAARRRFELKFRDGDRLMARVLRLVHEGI